jgi:peptidoglycan/xylan/chitin deacetylase (PgdA/CDA1 family)
MRRFRGVEVKDLTVRLLHGCGLFSVMRSLSANLARILMYHDFSASGTNDSRYLNVEGIRLQFEFLRRYFRPVSLLRIAERAASGRPLDPKMVALTIDDGRRNCYEYFFPLMKEYGIPATFFVVSSFVGSQGWIWTDKVMWLAEQRESPKELLQHKLGDVFRKLNRLRAKDRDAWIDATAVESGIAIPPVAPPRYAACSWNELREMADSGLMEIGSHTATHPILSTLTDEESWQELTCSRAEIEQHVGKPVKSFCYPNGMIGDFRANQVRQAREAGYSCAVVAESGMVSPGSDSYQLARIGMTRKTSTIEIQKYLDGFVYYRQKLGLAKPLRRA